MKFPALSVCFFAMAVAVAAQENKVLPKESSMELPPELKQVELAMALRTDIAVKVVAGQLSTTAAVEQLRGRGTVSGLPLDPDVDLAVACIDIGRRLIVLGKPAAAEEFFRQSETALDRTVNSMPDSRARDKAMCLQQLSLIRGDYLNKAGQARLDIRQALALDPENKHLQTASAAFERDHPEQINARLNK